MCQRESFKVCFSHVAYRAPVGAFIYNGHNHTPDKVTRTKPSFICFKSVSHLIINTTLGNSHYLHYVIKKLRFRVGYGTCTFNSLKIRNMFGYKLSRSQFKEENRVT